MRRIQITALGSALAAAALAAAPLQAQQNYPQTLYWGSGLIDIPVAWVPALSGDMAINYSGKNFRPDPIKEKINYSGSINSQLVMSMALFGRVDLGYAAYSSNPEYGFFGRALLLRQSDLGGNTGLRWFVPSLAVGVRNVGPYTHIDRYGNGYILAPPGADPNARHLPDALHQNFKTSGTFYGVATKELSLRDFRPSWADMDLSLSVGYGNGLFKDDGGLGTSYANHATGGLFYGAKLGWDVGDRTQLAIMAENNAWDYNVGATLTYRGAQVGLYATELGSSQPSSATTPGSYAYRYQKIAFTLGWQTNLFALLRGDFLQRKEAALLRQRQLLLAEISRREQRIAALELEINRYQAQNLLELEQRRTAAEMELNEERSALKRLEDRLRRVEQQLPPQTTTPTPTAPPSTAPAPSSTPPSTGTPSTSTPPSTPSSTPTSTPPQR